MNFRLLFAVVLFGSSAVQADFTLTGRSTLSALNMPKQGRETLYVNNNLMRRDITDNGRSYSYLYDIKKKEIAVVDHFMRQAEVHALTRPVNIATKASDLKLKLTPTSRKHTLQNWNCEEHALDASLPAEMGKEKVTVLLVGQVWLERKAKERKEIAPFLKTVATEDFFIGAAAAGKALGPQAQGINEAMRRVLDHGMLCAADIQLKYEGNGPMVDLARRMATKASIVYDTVTTETLKDELFAIPAGYKEIRN